MEISKEEILRALRKTFLFHKLSEPFFEEIADAGEASFINKNTIIFNEGEVAKGFYIVIKGSIKIFKVNFEGKEQILHVLHTGEPFGEVPLFAGGAFPATAKSIEASHIYFLEKQKLLNLYSKNPTLPLQMLATLCIRLREFSSQIESLSLHEIPRRLANYLLQSLEQQTISRHPKITLTTTKGILAKSLGSSQENLSRIFAKMRNKGLIQIDGKRIYIKNNDELQQIAAGRKQL